RRKAFHTRMARFRMTYGKRRMWAARWTTLALGGALGVGAVAAGCQHHVQAAAAAPATTVAATTQATPPTPTPSPPPFPPVPVLPGTGTPDIATLVAKVTPAVVNITTIHEVKAPRFDFDFPFGIPFGPFGGGRQGSPRGNNGGGGDEVYKQKALGSGFIVD